MLKLTESSYENKYNKVKLENNEATIILDIDSIMSIDRVCKEEYFKN